MYHRIQDYGLIGNMRTAALVSTSGSIDWLCLPNFDSPSVFAALLDDAKGGRFGIGPAAENVQGKQIYWPDTNVLVTRFLSDDGVAEMTDFMPLSLSEGVPPEEIVRTVGVVRGEVAFNLVCEPAFDYVRREAETTVTSSGAIFHSPGVDLALSSRIPLSATARGVRASFTLREGEHATFVLRRCDEKTCGLAPSDEEAQRALRGHHPLLAQVAPQEHLPRALARGRQSLGAHAQAADVRADRRDRGRADVQLARAARRRAQLGLPLHVDSGRRVHAVRVPPHRLHRRSGPVHGLAGVGLLPLG